MLRETRHQLRALLEPPYEGASFYCRMIPPPHHSDASSFRPICAQQYTKEKSSEWLLFLHSQGAASLKLYGYSLVYVPGL